MHRWWLPLGANISSYCHIPTLTASSLMSPLLLLWFSTIEFRTSGISYLSYLVSYSLRAGLKLHLFCCIWKPVLCEQFPSPECQPWLYTAPLPGLAPARHGLPEVSGGRHWHINPTNLKRWALAVLGGIFCKTPKQEPYADAFLLSQLTVSTSLLIDAKPTVTPQVHTHGDSPCEHHYTNLRRGLSSSHRVKFPKDAVAISRRKSQLCESNV